MHIIRLTVYLVYLLHQRSLINGATQTAPICFPEASFQLALIGAPKPSTCRCWLSVVSSSHVSEKHSKFASRYSVRNLALACSSSILLLSDRTFPRITSGRGGGKTADVHSLAALSFVVDALTSYCRQTRIQVAIRRLR